MDFDSFMDEWIDRPVAGLPLRMIYLCYWHRINAALAIIGGCIFLLGLRFNLPWIKVVGIVIGGPAYACFALLICSIPVFIILEKLFPNR